MYSYGFYNSDFKLWIDDDFNTILDILVASQGVIETGDLQVSSGTGMSVNIAPGRLVYETEGTIELSVKRWFKSTDTEAISIAPAHGTFGRYDIVCVKIDPLSHVATIVSSDADTNCKGNATSTPSVPATPSNYYKLAHVFIPAGSTSISAPNVTDTRSVILLQGVAALNSSLNSLTITVNGHTTTITDLLSKIVPVGAVIATAGSSADAGFLFAQGQAVSRTTYADLFAKIGTQYGAGDGSTTFNLPNLKGRVIVGIDSAQSEFDGLGETGGAKTVTLTADQLANHYHNAGGLVAGIGATGDDPINLGYFPTSPRSPTTLTSYTVRGASQTSASTNVNHNTQVFGETATPTGSGGNAHNNLQPYMALNYMIKI